MAAELRADRSFAQLVGLPTARRQVAGLPVHIRQLHNVETERAAQRVVSLAQAVVAVRHRVDHLQGYPGGALRQHLAYRMRPELAFAVVGLEKVAYVARRKADGRQRLTQYTDHRVKISGKWRRRVLARRAESRLREGGAVIVRPTRYGHLVEFGHRRGAGRGAAAARPFLRPAVRAVEPSFQAGHQQATAAVGRALAAEGYHP